MPAEIVDALDEYCRRDRMQPSRTRVIEVALREFLEREGVPIADPKVGKVA